MPGKSAKESRLDGPHNGPQDAYRHCLGSCVASGHYGTAVAEFLGDLNEGGGGKEEDMDLHNNAVGRECSEYIGDDTVEDCRRLCMNALNNEELWVLSTDYWE